MKLSNNLEIVDLALKYKDVLVLCNDKIKEAMAPLRAREMKKKAELEVCKIESQIAELKELLRIE